MVKKLNEAKKISTSKLAEEIWRLFDRLEQFYDQVEEDEYGEYDGWKDEFLKTIEDAQSYLGTLGDSIS